MVRRFSGRLTGRHNTLSIFSNKSIHRDCTQKEKIMKTRVESDTINIVFTLLIMALLIWGAALRHHSLLGKPFGTGKRLERTDHML